MRDGLSEEGDTGSFVGTRHYEREEKASRAAGKAWGASLGAPLLYVRTLSAAQGGEASPGAGCRVPPGGLSRVGLLSLSCVLSHSPSVCPQSTSQAFEVDVLREQKKKRTRQQVFPALTECPSRA